MKGRFQPTTVGNMARAADGGYVCFEDYESLREENLRLRHRDAQWIDFAMAVGRSVECLASSFPDANDHVLRRLTENRALRDLLREARQEITHPACNHDTGMAMLDLVERIDAALEPNA